MPTLIFGWAYDSTVAMTRLVYGRVLERFPEINWVVADVGGVLAFFAQRAINIYSGSHRRDSSQVRPQGKSAGFLSALLRGYRGSSGIDLALRQRFFWCPIAWCWERTIPTVRKRVACLVKNSLKAIDGLDLNAADKEKILGGNAARILGIGAP